MSSIMVSVTLVTYKQEEYIRQAIESILTQETEYTYEIVIGDDLSPDNTRKICEEYAAKYDNISLLPREKNLGVTMNWADCVQHCKGKYIMMLDGDDFWQNPKKMQMQVEYMEQHPECIMCHTDINRLGEKTGKLEHNVKQSSGTLVPEGMIQKEVISGREAITSSTICMRADAVHKYLPFDIYEKEDFPCEDWPTIVILAAYGEIRYLPVCTTTYRVGQESITNTYSYEKIKRYWTRSGKMYAALHRLFPDESLFDAGAYFETFMYNALLNAAYENGDYKNAKDFARLNPAKRLANYCAKNWLTFQLFRFYRIFRRQ